MYSCFVGVWFWFLFNNNNPTSLPIVYENGLLYEESSVVKALLLCRNVSSEEKLSAAHAFVFPWLKMNGTKILFSIQNTLNLHLGILWNIHKDSLSGNISSSLPSDNKPGFDKCSWWQKWSFQLIISSSKYRNCDLPELLSAAQLFSCAQTRQHYDYLCSEPCLFQKHLWILSDP